MTLNSAAPNTSMAEAEPWRQIYLYWLANCVAGRPPRRSQLDIPIALPRLLSNLMLIETVDDRFRYRLVGSAIWARYGLDLTGSWIATRNPAESEWRATLAAVRDDRMPRLLSSPLPGATGRSHVAVALPLLDETDKVHQILAGTFYALEIGQNLRVGPIVVEEIPAETP